MSETQEKTTKIHKNCGGIIKQKYGISTKEYLHGSPIFRCVSCEKKIVSKQEIENLTVEQWSKKYASKLVRRKIWD